MRPHVSFVGSAKSGGGNDVGSTGGGQRAEFDKKMAAAMGKDATTDKSRDKSRNASSDKRNASSGSRPPLVMMEDQEHITMYKKIKLQ